jgi:hypothetical protein
MAATFQTAISCKIMPQENIYAVFTSLSICGVPAVKIKSSLFFFTTTLSFSITIFSSCFDNRAVHLSSLF